MTGIGSIARFPTRARAVLGALAVLVVAAAAFGQSGVTGASARIEEMPVIVGKPFTFTIEVRGVDDAERPDLTSIARQFGVQDVGRSQSTSMEMVNGRMTSSTTVEFHYQMVARGAGSYTIPSVEVHAGNRTLRTNAVSFSAATAPQSDDFQVRIKVDNTNPYVGQPIQITLTIYTTSNFSMPRIDESGDFGRFDVTDVPNWNANLRQGFPFLGDQVQPIVGGGTLDGKAYRTIELARRLIPRESGHATLGPISVSTNFVTTIRQGLFESTQPGKDVRATTDAIDIDVRPLPKEGRPAFFTGLVGSYQAHADAEPKEANVGDPITVHVLVTGGPLIQDVRLPDLEALPGFQGKLRVSEDQPDRTFTQGGAMFTLRVRALSDAVDSIPPIEIAYFNPDNGEYGVAKTNPIPLRVRPTRRVTAVDAVGAAPVASGTTVESDRVGIAHNYDGAGALRVVPTSVLAEVSSPVWVATMAAPPLAYFACAFGVAMKRRGARTGVSRRRSRALPEAQGVLRGAESVDGIAGGIGAYFEMATGRPRASITPQDAEAMVAPVAPEEAARLRGILERCDAARFAGASVEDVRAMREEASALLRAIDPKMKRMGGA